jgi:hypothetical protein
MRLIPACGDIDSSAPSSAPEPGANIPLDHCTFLQWMSRWGARRHESGSASFGITQFSHRKDAYKNPRSGSGKHVQSFASGSHRRNAYARTLGSNVFYQNSQTLTHAACAATGTSIAKTYGGPIGYRRRPQARTVPRMSQCLRSLVFDILNDGLVSKPVMSRAALEPRRYRSAKVNGVDHILLDLSSLSGFPICNEGLHLDLIRVRDCASREIRQQP